MRLRTRSQWRRRPSLRAGETRQGEAGSADEAESKRRRRKEGRVRVLERPQRVGGDGRDDGPLGARDEGPVAQAAREESAEVARRLPGAQRPDAVDAVDAQIAWAGKG